MRLFVMGTCRVHNPLQSVRYYKNFLYTNWEGNGSQTGYLSPYFHALPEMIQFLRLLRGECSLPSHLLKYVFFSGAWQLPIEAKEILDSTQAYLIEISSEKVFSAESFVFHHNELARLFPHTAGPRTHQWWGNLEHERQCDAFERHAILEELKQAKIPTDETTPWVLEKLKLHFLNLEEIEEIFKNLQALLQKPIFLVSHIDVKLKTGYSLPERVKVIERLAEAAQSVNLPLFQPASLLEVWDQSALMAEEGKDLYHYHSPALPIVGEALLKFVHKHFFLPKVPHDPPLLGSSPPLSGEQSQGMLRSSSEFSPLETARILQSVSNPKTKPTDNFKEEIRPLSKLSGVREVHSVFVEDKNTCLSPTANEDAFLKEESYEDLGAEDRSVLGVHSLALLSKASISATPKTTHVTNVTGYEDLSTKSTPHFSTEVEFRKRSMEEEKGITSSARLSRSAPPLSYHPRILVPERLAEIRTRYQGPAYARRYDILHHVYDKINLPYFLKLQEKYCANVSEFNSSGPLKYFDLAFWLWHSTAIAEKFNIDQGPPRRILDIGMGRGYFSGICRAYHHECLTLGVPPGPQRDLCHLLDVTCIPQDICAGKRTPRFNQKFDLVTAIWVNFNYKGLDSTRQPTYWNPEEWKFFLEDIATHMNRPGDLYLELTKQKQKDGSWTFDESFLQACKNNGAYIAQESGGCKIHFHLEQDFSFSTLEKATI